MGSGANNTARYTGAAVGTTLVVLLTTSAGDSAAPAALLADWNTAAYAGAAVALAGALGVAALRLRPARVPAVAPAVPVPADRGGA
jgi:hypothetical protein